MRMEAILRKAGLYLATAIVFGALSYFGVTFTRADQRIAAIWLPNAVVLVVLLRQSRIDPGVILAAFLANCLSNLSAGDDWARGMGLSLANTIEIVIAAFGIKRFLDASPELPKLTRVIRFLQFACLLGPAASATFAVTVLGAGAGNPFQTWTLWWLTDALGMALVAPCLWIFLLAFERKLPAASRSRREWCAHVLLTTAGTLAVFSQTKYPLLFLAAPLVVLCAFRLGVLGTAVITWVEAVIAVALTARGAGPIALTHGSMTEQVIVLQCFVAANLALGLPIAATLDRMRGTMDELRASERRFQVLADLLPAGIFRTDVDGRATYTNRAWQEVAGFEDDGWLGHGWAKAVHPDDAADVVEKWHQTVERKGSFTSEYRFQRPRGDVTWVQAIGRPETDDDGTVTGYIGVAFDVTATKKLIEDLHFAQVEAKAASLAKSTFLANMSHEIRTPMNGVLGFAQLLLDDDLLPRQREQAQIILDSGKGMMQILNDILDISKVEAGQMSIAREPMGLIDVVENCANLMQSVADHKGIQFAVEIDASCPERILGDPMRLRQIITNLLGNALKFTHRGHVTLRASGQDLEGGRCRVALEVEDTGVGIPPERQETIFRPFEQASQSVGQAFGGTGLGLSISTKLVELMGGAITLTSAVGCGSTFRVEFETERLASERRCSERRTLSRQSVAALQPRSSQLKILLAEDHDVNQLLVLSQLRPMGCYVEVAQNGREAIAILEKAQGRGEAFDLVLMDMQMPEMGGIEAARAIRAMGFTPEALPIVALTANAFNDDIAACLEAGMQAHIAKPANKADLAAALRRWCGGATVLPLPLERRSATSARPEVRADLRERYEIRKREALESVARMLSVGVFDDAQIADVKGELHKLAGTASLFGDAALGDDAKVLERGMIEWPVEERAARIALAATKLLQYG